jgi:hypothetical protein
MDHSEIAKHIVDHCQSSRHYWQQGCSAEKQEAGRKLIGLRSAVTGGAQMDRFIDH